MGLFFSNTRKIELKSCIQDSILLEPSERTINLNDIEETITIIKQFFCYYVVTAPIHVLTYSSKYELPNQITCLKKFNYEYFNENFIICVVSIYFPKKLYDRLYLIVYHGSVQYVYFVCKLQYNKRYPYSNIINEYASYTYYPKIDNHTLNIQITYQVYLGELFTFDTIITNLSYDSFIIDRNSDGNLRFDLIKLINRIQHYKYPYPIKSVYYDIIIFAKN